MKYFPLIWRNLLRRKTRAVITLLTIFVSFVLFGFLMAFRGAFTMGVEVASAERLVMIHKVSLIQPLPISYWDQIKATPGVVLSTHNSWFGGTYQDRANEFAIMAAEPETFRQVFPEFKYTDDELKAWKDDRQGAVVGRATATRFGWKIGDRIPIRATIFQPKEGDTWFFNIRGIYDGAPEIDKTTFYFRHDYLEENRRFGAGTVGWYTIRIADANRSAEIGSILDAKFANSASETKTSPEKAFMQGFANQIGNISFMMIMILSAVLFVMLIVVANTMMQSVRERTNELAVLKTLGFSNGLVLTLVLLESVLLAVVGGSLGLGLAWMGVQSGGFNTAFLPVFMLATKDILLGAALCVGLGVLAGLMPATSAMQLKITDALRRN